MSKSILISIKPQYVEKILNREKIYEIRSTVPKEWKEYLEGKTSVKPAPSKWYIYCTKAKPTLQYFYNWGNYKPISEYSTWAAGSTINAGEYGNGKIVAEFTLKNISYWQPYWTPEVMHICDISEKSCVSIEDLMKYCGDEIIYALHIEDLKIYDKPKELSEFRFLCKDYIPFYMNGCDEICGYYENGECKNGYIPLRNPPRDWRYVESLDQVKGKNMVEKDGE